MEQIVIIKKLILLITALMTLLGFNPDPKLGVALPLTDYKFAYIVRKDDIHISEAAIRFFEGAITTENEIRDGNLVPVTRYRRTRRLTKIELQHLKSKDKFEKDKNGNDMKIYTSEDFGVISTDNELRLFLNQELAKDLNHTPIPEQTGNVMK